MIYFLILLYLIIYMNILFEYQFQLFGRAFTYLSN